MKFIKSLDSFGSQFAFTIHKKDKYQTVIGAFLTIILLILAIVFALIFGRDFFYKMNPIINYQNLIGIDYYREQLDSSKFLVPWTIIDGTGNKINYTGIIYPLVTYYSYQYDSENSNYKLKNKIRLNSSYCDSKYDSIMPGVAAFNCLNIDNMNLTIGGGWDGKFVDYFSITLYYCSNYGNFDPKANCTPLETLNKFFGKTIYFSIFYPNLHFEGNNYSDPFQIQYINYYYQLSTGLVKTDRYYFEKAVLQDDTGIVLQNVKNSSIYHTFSMKSDYFVTNPNLYNSTGTLSVIYQSIFYLEKNYDLYIRSYMKLQSLTAQIGGFINILEIFCSIFSGIINKYFRNLKFINQVFDFEDEKSDREQELMLKKNIDNIMKDKMDNLDISDNKIDKSDLKIEKSSNFSGNSKIIFFQKKESINKNKLEVENKGESIDSKLISIINKSGQSKKKFNPGIFLLIKKTIWCGKVNKDELTVIDLYETSKKFIDKKLDLFEYLKMIETLENVKSFLFSEEQIISMNYLKRVNLNNSKNRELIKTSLRNDKLADLKMIFRYFAKKFEMNTMNEIDFKIFHLLDENLKKIF